MLEKIKSCGSSRALVNRLIKHPVEVFSGIISGGLAIYSIYYMLPMSYMEAGILSVLFSNPIEHLIIGGILALLGSWGVFAAIQSDPGRLHRVMFFVMLAWAVMTLLRIISFGFFPVGGWLFFWMSCLKSMICYLYLGTQTRRGGK